MTASRVRDTGGRAAVEATGVAISRSDRVILQDVQVALLPATFTALAGPSGSGKTSLLRVLAALDQPSAGHVRFWGRECRVVAGYPLVDGAPLYPSVCYVPQTLSLWPHLSLRQNLRFALAPDPDANEVIEHLSGQLEIAEVLDRLPSRTSQGQQQRTALARALLLKPSLLLLDEVTAALDERLASKVWALLRCTAGAGTAILASTHDSRLSQECDAICRIRDISLSVETP